MSRRTGREQTNNDYWLAVEEKQLPKEYDHVPMGQEAAYRKMKDFEERQKGAGKNYEEDTIKE